MKIYYKSDQMPEIENGAVVAVGNFDGVHLGHQKVLAQARKLANAEGLPVVAFTFEPHPKTVIGSGVDVLTHFQDKAELLADFGADIVYAEHFTKEFAQTTPEDFCQKILAEFLRARHVCVGADFSFGAKGAGTVKTLQEQAIAGGFTVHAVDHATDAHGEKISSSRVRAALAAGDMAEVMALLGHTYSWKLCLKEDDMLNLVGDVSTYAPVKKGVYWVRFNYTNATDGQGEDGEHPEILAAALVGGKMMFPPVLERPGVPHYPVKIELLEAQDIPTPATQSII